MPSHLFDTEPENIVMYPPKIWETPKPDIVLYTQKKNARVNARTSCACR